MSRALCLVITCVATVAALEACDSEPHEETGRPCEVPDDCFPEVDPEDLSGPIECLDRVPDGYCTHHCETDEDCCAAPDECEFDLPQVCAPFESTGLMLCFLSCEDADIGDWNDADYCREYGHPAFNCRSTGGGSDNRKVCVP